MARIGGTKCQICGNGDATVSRTATGTLSITCHRCEGTAFAKVGTRAHRLVSAAMTPDDDEQPDKPAASPVVAAIKTKPAPTARDNPPPVDVPPAPPRRVASVFALSDL